jgi:hypothetical protein
MSNEKEDCNTTFTWYRSMMGKAELPNLLKGLQIMAKAIIFRLFPRWQMDCILSAENFMLLQPDSKLYIVPTTGGIATELNCNLPLMNSWHAWSPTALDSFCIKRDEHFYRFILTHIDEKGNASAPILVEKARKYRQVVNYPEFY